MGRVDLSKFVRQFKRVLAPEALNGLGRAVRLCRRERVITPYHLALSCLASCATMRVETLADIQRTFNALFGTGVAYKPFHNQLAKCQFCTFMREVVASMLEHWVVRVLPVKAGSAFSEFSRSLIQDGSPFALEETFSGVYPGRFKSKGPAAMDRHGFVGSIRRIKALSPEGHGYRRAVSDAFRPERHEILPNPTALA